MGLHGGAGAWTLCFMLQVAFSPAAACPHAPRADEHCWQADTHASLHSGSTQLFQHNAAGSLHAVAFARGDGARSAQPAPSCSVYTLLRARPPVLAAPLPHAWHCGCLQQPSRPSFLHVQTCRMGRRRNRLCVRRRGHSMPTMRHGQPPHQLLQDWGCGVQ